MRRTRRIWIVGSDLRAPEQCQSDTLRVSHRRGREWSRAARSRRDRRPSPTRAAKRRTNGTSIRMDRAPEARGGDLERRD